MDRGQPYQHNGPDRGPSSTSLTNRPYLRPSIPSTVEIPSFTAFQAQAPRASISSPVRRKPLPPSASPAKPRPLPLSSGGKVVAVGEEDSAEHPPGVPWLPTSTSDSPLLVARDLDQFPRGQSPLIANAPKAGAFPSNSQRQPPDDKSYPTRLNHVRLASESVIHDISKTVQATNSEGPQRAMSLHPSTRPPNLHINADHRSFHNHEQPQDPASITRTPRSPGPNKLTSFFGWKTSSPVAENSPTNFSTASQSPAPSPLSPTPRSLSSSTKSMPQAIEAPKTHATISSFIDTGFPLPPQNSAMSTQIADMEEELREVSSELAGSIRRELELEDLVDRLQLEVTQGPDMGRRTSDYFSDSGTSSIRYPTSDNGGSKMEDLAKMQRLSEQEKARFKLDLSQKLQDERARRKAAETHMQHLGEQLQHIDQERAAASSTSKRVRDLENSLEDHRRRLSEERKIKANFEDLLNALRDEIEKHKDERDNLRDEVIPQLQAQVEGLETDALEHQKFMYENARMQQELQSLKNENTTLMNARRLQLEMQQHASRFNSIAEEDEPPPATPTAKIGLTRSSSVARSSGASGMGGLSRTGSLSRHNSITAKDREPRDSLADRVKDIEMQRDALHRALKSLLDRQNYQNKEHEKKIRVLEAERDRALEAQSPRRTGYEKEVTGLRFEINQLRRRADDALMQKWQCEKGLGGLKMDLDRAEQETSSLRTLLQEHDILVPDVSALELQEIESGTMVTSASLERAYNELQATQALSIEKIRELHGQVPSSGDDAHTAETMDSLLKSITDAEAQRDYAQKQAEVYRAKAESLQEAESFQTGENAGLIEQLRASANRVESLAGQVRLQLASNSDLRQRLAEAVGRGEREQQSSAARINSMQGKLKTLEDKLMSAQQHSEEAFAKHDEEVREIKDSHNNQLQRLKSGLRTPTFHSPNSPLSPMFAARSPKLSKTTSGVGMSMNEALRTEVLENKVVELERALGDADKEMEEVVSRMNLAQIEVMELQSARDEAMRQTRKLQAAINVEREKVDTLMK